MVWFPISLAVMRAAEKPLMLQTPIEICSSELNSAVASDCQYLKKKKKKSGNPGTFWVKWGFDDSF